MGIILSRWMNFKRAGVGERSFGFCWGEFGMGEFARVFKRTIQEVFLSSVGMKIGDRMSVLLNMLGEEDRAESGSRGQAAAP
jgi:hypothetical protein